MNARDPDGRDGEARRPASALPRRTETTALYALRPVPEPRTPADGPFPGRAAAGPVPRPRPAADAEPVRTPPMPWTVVAGDGPRPPTRARRPRRVRILETDVDRRVALALAVAVLLVVAAALLLGGVARPDGEAARSTAEPPVLPDLAAGATVVDGARFGTDELSFRSPTGNIGCRMASDAVRCSVAGRDWQLPPGAPDCPPGEAGMALAGSGPAVPACGVPAPRSAPTLDYALALRRDDVTCMSRRDGVECRNAASGHGFTLSRSDVRAYLRSAQDRSR